ncbi:MAG TPA: hypothetical protein VEU47_19155 [Candidatus Cybelea sp.]|nr:hypothetical protein [Candidatus Cybelea sp.]
MNDTLKLVNTIWNKLEKLPAENRKIVLGMVCQLEAQAESRSITMPRFPNDANAASTSNGRSQ